MQLASVSKLLTRTALSSSIIITESATIKRLGNTLLEAEECVGSPHGKVRCRKRLGGLLSYCHRAAA